MKHATSRRSMRLGDQIFRELASLVSTEIKDPRLELVSITGVVLNADMKIALVRYTVMGDDERHAEAQKGLEKATGHLRSQLSKALRIKFVPELRFERDQFLEDMVYVDNPG